MNTIQRLINKFKLTNVTEAERDIMDLLSVNVLQIRLYERSLNKDTTQLIQDKINEFSMMEVCGVQVLLNYNISTHIDYLLDIEKKKFKQTGVLKFLEGLKALQDKMNYETESIDIK